MPAAHGLRHSTLAIALLLLPLFFATGTRCGKVPKKVTIETPANGTFVAPGTLTVDASGRVTGLNPLDVELRVNGVLTPVAFDGSWSAVVDVNQTSLFSRIRARMTDLTTGAAFRARNVLIVGDSVADGDFSFDSIALRLNDSGLDAIEPEVSGFVDLDLATLLPPGTTVINDYCAIDGGFVGCLGSVDVTIISPAPTIDSFGLDVDSMTDFAAGDVIVNDVVVNARINGSGLAPSCNLRLTADSATIAGDYALEPDAVDPSLIDVNLIGAPGIALAGFNDEFTSGLCDFPLIGDLIQLIIGDIRPIVENGLVSFLADPDGAGPLDAPIAEGIETALSEITIAGAIGEGLGVQLEAPLFKVEEDVDGITLGSDGRIMANIGTGPGQCDAPPTAPDFTASLSVPEPFPVFGPLTPGGLPYGLGICISTAAFNQLLKAEVECGLLQADLVEIDLTGNGLEPITAGLLAPLVPELGGLPPDNPLEIRLRPTIAPVLTGNPGPQGEIGELGVGGLAWLLVDVGRPIPKGLLGGQIDFFAGLDFSFDDQTGSLVPTISTVEQDDITIFISKNSIGANTGQVSFILKSLLPNILPTLGDSLGSFPLPAFLGLNLQAVSVEQNGEFLSIFADLVPAP